MCEFFRDDLLMGGRWVSYVAVYYGETLWVVVMDVLLRTTIVSDSSNGLGSLSTICRQLTSGRRARKLFGQRLDLLVVATVRTVPYCTGQSTTYGRIDTTYSRYCSLRTIMSYR